MEHKKWRKAHPKYRNARRKANYHKGRPKAEKAKRRPSGVRHFPWTMQELELFHLYEGMNKISDRDLAKMIGRSVQAIQQKRYQIKNAKS